MSQFVEWFGKLCIWRQLTRRFRSRRLNVSKKKFAHIFFVLQACVTISLDRISSRAFLRKSTSREFFFLV